MIVPFIFTIYALLSQYLFCRDLRTFSANFCWPKQPSPPLFPLLKCMVFSCFNFNSRVLSLFDAVPICALHLGQFLPPSRHLHDPVSKYIFIESNIELENETQSLGRLLAHILHCGSKLRIWILKTLFEPLEWNPGRSCKILCGRIS